MDIIHKAIRAKQNKERPYCAAVIVAAGNAARMQGVDKMLANIGGLPVVLRTLLVFEVCKFIDEIVVVTREDLCEKINLLCEQHSLLKVRAVISGGAERTNSVMAGLDAISEHTGLVAIHDGARPLVDVDIIERTIMKAKHFGAAAPAVPLKDTVKVIKGGLIDATPDRNTLVAIQTPQVFDKDLIRGAIYRAIQDGERLTDDCAAVERMGMKVALTEGSEENLKITTPFDLTVARTIVNERETK